MAGLQGATETLDLLRFCDADSPRIATPFVIDGWKYYTDGRVCVRLKCAGEPNAPLFEKRPAANNVFHLPTGGNWTPWPTVKTCEVCTGAGHVVQTCRKCHGSAMCVCDCCENEHKCGWCDGNGESDELCDCRSEWIATLGKMNLSRHYLSLIGSLPQAEMYSLPAKDIIQFRFAGGEGAVMPSNAHKD